MGIFIFLRAPQAASKTQQKCNEPGPQSILQLLEIQGSFNPAAWGGLLWGS